jgi:hypothetical protein
MSNLVLNIKIALSIILLIVGTFGFMVVDVFFRVAFSLMQAMHNLLQKAQGVLKISPK